MRYTINKFLNHFNYYAWSFFKNLFNNFRWLGNRKKKIFSNAIHRAGTPNIDEIKKYYPMASLQASGISVGLPFNKAGNSEVGHLTLGTGQILYQYSVRISQSIQNGSFFQNPALSKIYNHVKKNNSTLHIAGLFSNNIVHSSYKHLMALLDLANALKNRKGKPPSFY